MKRTILTAITAGLFSLTLAACNTVSGAGEDLQSASESVEDEINE